MLSLAEFRRAARVLESRLTGARVERVVQPDDFRVALVFRAASTNTLVLLSCRPESAGLCVVESLPNAPSVSPTFAQSLRARLVRGNLETVGVSDQNRQASLHISTRDGALKLILCLLGSRSNIYMLDEMGRLIHSLRPLEKTRSELKLGEPYKDPDSVLGNEGLDRWATVADEKYLEEIGKAFQLQELKREFQTLSRRLESVLDREEGFLARKLINLQQDLAEARQAHDFRRKGELLKSVLHRIRQGDEAVETTDYSTGARVEIPLRTDLSPADNLEAYFARYQKGTRGVGAIEQQLAETLSARVETEALRRRLMEATVPGTLDLPALERLAAEPRIRKLIARYYPTRAAQSGPIKAKSKEDVPRRLLPKRYRTNQGLEIWVGRNDEGNDYLTTRLARGNDLFFHLEGYPGSHVVLRTEGRTDPPPDAVLDACELAVHFSKLKDVNRADVHVTPVKNVKKPKGVKPGLVYVQRGKTIHLRRSAKRLQEILASRIDE